MTTLQPVDELDRFYAVPDPWGYARNADDARRKTELLSLLPSRQWGRTLDIGCGDGFLTFDLPGSEVVGVDVSAAAIRWACEARGRRVDAQRFQFSNVSVFKLDPCRLGTFDLIVITGVLYPQYIGKAFSVVAQHIDALLGKGGLLASCHIDEWKPPKFPYTTLDTVLYPYRDHTHRLEVYKK